MVLAVNAELVSIITPAYKAGRFVTETIQSVQSQDYPHWEMLVVDDCSPDDTCEKVAAEHARDNRIKLLRHTQNGGPAVARNTALQAAAGRWLAFLDSDDLWLRDKLSSQIEFMRERNAALSFTGCRRISEDGSKVGHLLPVPERMSYRDLLRNTAIITSTVILDRTLVGNVRMPRACYDDFALWLRVLNAGHTAHGLARDLARYRVVGRSVSRNKGKSALMMWSNYRETEGLGLLDASWCFANYAFRACLKYRRF